MKVEIALDINNGQSLASRVAPVHARGQAPRRGGAGAGGRGRVAPAAGGRAPKQRTKTAEELDAEMSVCAPSQRLLTIQAYKDTA